MRLSTSAVSGAEEFVSAVVERILKRVFGSQRPARKSGKTWSRWRTIGAPERARRSLPEYPIPPRDTFGKNSKRI